MTVNHSGTVNALFHDGLALVSLGSGSRGNATYVGDGRRGVLIDCGLSAQQVVDRLAAVGLADAPIDAVLITHEHTDHVAAAAVLDRRLHRLTGAHVPFFMTEGTARQLHPKVRPTRVEHVTPGQPVQLTGWTLEPHPVPHDTAGPVAWAVEARGVRVGVITDLGHVPNSITQLLAGLDLAVLEFNHDPELLLDGPYPWALKQRIRGGHGHLSNRQAAALLRAAGAGRLQQVVLAHLSEENNRPALALQAAELALRDAGAHDVRIHVGAQGSPTGPLRAGARPVAVPRAAPVRTGRAAPRTSERAASQPSLFATTPSPPQ
jgi:phosphoribosyl 1,2-cyclic phosphodiesterase